MGRYSAAWVAGAKANGVFPVVTVEFPSGTHRYGPAGADEDYPYEPRLAAVGRIKIGVPERPGALGFPEWTFSLHEGEDQAITLLLESQDVMGSPVTVAWLAHDADPAVSTIHQATLATGLLSRKKRGRVGQWDLTYSPDSRALKSKVTKQMILKGEHPLAVGNPWGIHMPQVYGVHDSAGLGGAGMLPAINISHSATLGYYWLVSQGYLVGVPQVFVDGIDQSGDFDTVRAVRAGKMLTYISFVGEGAAPGAAAVITVDAEGLETEGDGTGAGIANPVAQLRHWLTAFGIGDYKQGSWPAMNVLIDGDSWAAAETWAGKYGLEGAMYVGGVREQIEAIDVVNRWLETWPQIRLYWTHLGKLAMGLVQPVLRDSNVSAEHFIRLEEPEAFDLQPDDDTALIITRVNQTYLYDVGAVKYWQSLDLQDVSRDEEIADSIAAVYSAARLE